MSGFYKDIVAVLQSHGFLLVRQGKGSHEIWGSYSTCVFTAHYFNNKSIITVEGQANYDEQGKPESLSPIQQAFIDSFAFQCGYCAPGFVTGATVFIDGLKRQTVRREHLESAIADALNEHICRCTGYVRYYKAVKEVALATPGCVID